MGFVGSLSCQQFEDFALFTSAQAVGLLQTFDDLQLEADLVSCNVVISACAKASAGIR